MEHRRHASGASLSTTAGSASHLYEASTSHGPPTIGAVHGGPSFVTTTTTHTNNRAHSPVPSSARSMTSNGYGQPFPYATMAGPPAMGQDHFLGSDGSAQTPGLSPTHSSSAAAAAAALSAQKRAYRQRRKDPSCDACRERKVKCDATDTSSCSECSSRGVKCQFTKETNRRMSSIKQVQDLEKQLSLAKQQISNLKGILRDNGAVELDHEFASVPALHISEPTADDRRHATPLMEGFDETRRNIRDFSRGIFQLPPSYRLTPPQPAYPYAVPALPPKAIADRLISHYHGFVHVFAPLLHWPTFVAEYEELYRVGSFQESAHSWVALFHAVLACGTLMDPQPSGPISDAEGARYMEACFRSIDTWSDLVTPDAARIALLISIYFVEVNLKTSGWVWLGAAVQIAQDLGLHNDHGPYTPFELEMRRRIWWSVYNWDRMVSLEFGRPLLIDDDDCEVQEPTPVEDEYIRSTGIVAPPHGQSPPSGLVAVIPIVRITAQLRKSFKARVIASATLSTYDEHFRTIMASFPEPFPIHSPAYLDPRFLMACCSMQASRFFLYRHNLTTAARPHDRRSALDRCVSVAKDTAQYIERSLQHGSPASSAQYYSPAHMASWGARLRTMSSAFLCTHLWRCTLVSCLRLECATALTLVQASAAIGDLRKINVACGRHLSFFLEKLAARLHAGATMHSLETDEEMMAYASGDMQGRSFEAWIWAGGDGDALPSSESSDRLSKSTQGGQSTSSQLSHHQAMPLSERERERQMQEWGGWDHIQRVLQHLLHDIQQQHQQHQNASMSAGSPSAYAPPSTASTMPTGHVRQTSFHGPGSGSSGQLTAPDQRSTSVSPGPASTRISIKDIM